MDGRLNRRSFLQLCSLGALSSAYPHAHAVKHANQTARVELFAKTGETKIVGRDFPATAVWGYNGQIPGPPIRISHGQSLDVTVNNLLEVPTSVHWHGIRLPNAMDGVAGLTQAAINPGQSFRYQFSPPDSGTYWYHSHVNAHEQIGRGMYGPLIIEEVTPPVVDRELVWMIDDWRLLDDASISDDFSSGHDLSHAGRIGNVPTVNGRFRDVVKVRSGERIRLRLINASNARNFALSFGELLPTVIAIDGQAVTPYKAKAPVIVGAAGRVDLILDMIGDPDSSLIVTDSFYRNEFDLCRFAYDKKPLRNSAINESMSLQPPQLPEPDLSNAQNLEIVIAGGAMGGLQRAIYNGEWLGLREIAQHGYVWAMNDIVGNKLDMSPLISAKRGQTIRLTMRNETAFPHPMHLHGHHMKLLSIDNNVQSDPRWLDSPLLMPKQSMQLAFVADNPGDWLFHCHVLEHHRAGLGALVRVA